MSPQLKALLGLSLSFLIADTQALQSDSLEKLHITADSTTYNFKTDTTLFSGHVIANQGSTHLTAEKVITKANAKHDIQEIIAYGHGKTQAHYSTLPRPNDQAMHAFGDIIQYYPLSANVTLHKHVTVLQGENSFQGELIHYNMNEQTITVPPSPKARAVIVYNQD